MYLLRCLSYQRVKLELDESKFKQDVPVLIGLGQWMDPREVERIYDLATWRGRELSA